MQPTEELKTEHRAIERMLHILEKVATLLEGDRTVRQEDLEQIITFIQVFADRCHHAKEEDLLFGAMQEAGIPRQGGPIEVMLMEHEQGRGYVAGMRQALSRYAAGEGAAASDIAKNARGYVALLTQHIAKEDNILYPLADRVLSPQQQKALREGFEDIEEHVIGHGRHEAFHALLERLERDFM